MSSPDPIVSEAMIPPGPKMVSHDAGLRGVNATNGFRHVLIVTLRALVSDDEAVIQAHVVGQRVHRSGADDVSSTAGVQLPRTGIPMVNKTLVHGQHLAVVPISPAPKLVVIGVGPMVG